MTSDPATGPRGAESGILASASEGGVDGASLVIAGLTKRYRSGTVANEGVELTVRPGEVFGLLGPNGAGKTTLVRQIVGLLKPTSGTIHLGGVDLVAEPDRARRLCSYLPQGAIPLDSFRPVEIAELVGRIRGLDRRTARARTRELIAALELDSWAETMGTRLSGGVRRLVGFVLAAVAPTPVVILDEPTNDVDPLRRRLLWRRIRALADAGASVLLVTHNVLEAEQAVHRLAVIDHGRVLAQGTPSELKAAQRDVLRLSLSVAPGNACPAPPPFARRQVLLGRRFDVLVAEEEAAAAIEWSRAAMERGEIEEYALAATTLEDVYVRLIGRADALDFGDAPEAGPPSPEAPSPSGGGA